MEVNFSAVAQNGWRFSPRGGYQPRTQNLGPRPNEIRYYVARDGSLETWAWKDGVNFHGENADLELAKTRFAQMTERSTQNIRGDTFIVGKLADGTAVYFCSRATALVSGASAPVSRVLTGDPYANPQQVASASTTDAAPAGAPAMIPEDLPQ